VIVSGFKLFINGTTDTRVFQSLSELTREAACAHLRGDEWDVRHDLGTRPLTPDEGNALMRHLIAELRGERS
jgi:hypothetical protein